MNIRVLNKIFRLCEARSHTHDMTVHLSMLEIYNEEVDHDCLSQRGVLSDYRVLDSQLRDLLCDDSMLGHDHRLEIRTVGTQSGTTVQIPQLTRVEIKNVQEALAVYDRGC
ncbi:MAG: hypothetical protein ACK56I_04760, partial [bacterium]